MKLYADEAGHEQVRALPVLAVAQIARVEVPAALWRKHRMGELGAEDARTLTTAFEADYYGGGEEVSGDDTRLVVLATTADILDQAAVLCATHGLRAYDAVQLSSALATRRAEPGCSTMAVFDGSLRAAASAEGFQLLPEKAPPHTD